MKGLLVIVENTRQRENLTRLRSTTLPQMRHHAMEVLNRGVASDLPDPLRLVPVRSGGGTGSRAGGVVVPRDYFRVGDGVSGSGRPDSGRPYVIPTVDEWGRMCDMQIRVDEVQPGLYGGGWFYSGVVVAITPVDDQQAWNIWAAKRKGDDGLAF